MKTNVFLKNIFSILMVAFFVILFPLGYKKLGVQANSIAVIPIIGIALIHGMEVGAIFGVSISVFISAIRIINHDPAFVSTNAIIFAMLAGFGGGVFGLLSDQRKALKRSEENLSRKVEEQTIELQRLLKELKLAYETTLEGWSRALELRDKETEGHSRRVTELATALARKLEFDEDEVRHVYYGSLLHDIGKMGIPDEILHKPGALTAEEREIVNQHPVFAFDLLKEIEYLQSAILIPYCHHENWDGTGYPLRLQGEQIPLLARIFAVVDNWDALTSDRPYRKAWSREATVDYIKEQSGKKFDPQVAEIFLNELINKTGFLKDASQHNVPLTGGIRPAKFSGFWHWHSPL